MPRPRKKLDKAMVRDLAAIGLSTAEIAAILDCSSDTIERRFMPAMEAGRLKRNASLRRKQYELAVGGHPTMLIWLGKQFLGQKDKMEHTGDLKIQRVLLAAKPLPPEKPLVVPDFD